MFGMSCWLTAILSSCVLSWCYGGLTYMWWLTICDACCAHWGTEACLVWPYVMHVVPMRVLEHAYVREMCAYCMTHSPFGGATWCVVSPTHSCISNEECNEGCHGMPGHSQLSRLWCFRVVEYIDSWCLLGIILTTMGCLHIFLNLSYLQQCDRPRDAVMRY